MLRPIVFLEHYFDSASREWIAHHANLLKELGYNKFLLEMNAEVSVEDFIIQNKTALKNPTLPPHIKKACIAMEDMLNALQKADIEIEFIDPQSQKEATQLELNLKQAPTLEARQQAVMQLNQTKIDRDIFMAEKFTTKAGIHEGGVFALCGFAHKQLLHNINGLTLGSALNSCYVILSQAAQIFAHDFSEESTIWKSMPNASFREEFYNTDVNIIENPLQTSFGFVEHALALSERTKVTQSVIGESFDAAVGKKLAYELDKNATLSGTLNCDTQQDLDSVATTIKQKFPGLYFQKGRSPLSLEVIGLNLPENVTRLQKGFGISN